MLFIDTGIEKQLNCTTETECRKNMEISCSICCRTGVNIQCDKCPIASAYEQQKAAIIEARKAERQLRQKKAEELQKIAALCDSAREIYQSVRCPRDMELNPSLLESLADEYMMLKGLNIFSGF